MHEYLAIEIFIISFVVKKKKGDSYDFLIFGRKTYQMCKFSTPTNYSSFLWIPTYNLIQL